VKRPNSGKATTESGKPYQAPAIVVLGSLHQLTLDTKVGHVCDLTCYHQGSA
jgi:hypothetical protein